jgi:hypothetical protein
MEPPRAARDSRFAFRRRVDRASAESYARPMDGNQSKPLRCRLGFHKWTRYKVGDRVAGQAGPAKFGDAVRAGVVGPDAFGAGDGWETRCRYCQKRRRLLDVGPPSSPV